MAKAPSPTVPKVHRRPLCTTDAEGSTLIENQHGRFKLNTWTGKYEPIE